MKAGFVRRRTPCEECRIGHFRRPNGRARVLRIALVSLASLENTCGQLIVAGFSGTRLPDTIRGDLARGALGGIILFKRNLTSDVLAVSELTRAAAAAARESGLGPTLIAIDQEGGRVARLGAPVVRLPPMLELGSRGESLLEEAGALLGGDLRALGFSTGLSPVLDVHSNPANPVIGDRAFGETAGLVTARALAFARGLRRAGVAACGKHFPGHGDTERDSHFELPVVRHARARLDAVELAPFRAAAAAGFNAFMSAHVLYTELDAAAPATLSPRIATEILRGELGFGGVLFSDDLEMRALGAPIEETSVAAVRAGCDALLICSDEARVARAREALVRAAEASAAFRARVDEAGARLSTLRRRYPPETLAEGPLRAHFDDPGRQAHILALAGGAA